MTNDKLTRLPKRVRCRTDEGRLNFLLSIEMNAAFENSRRAQGDGSRTDLARRYIANGLARDGFIPEYRKAQK